MAKYELGILGPFRGKVGTVVGSQAHGVRYIRAYQPNVKNPRTAAQVSHRAAFALAGRLATHLAPLMRGLRPALRPLQAHNAAVRCLLKDAKLKVTDGRISGLQAGPLRLVAPPDHQDTAPLEGLAVTYANQQANATWSGPDNGNVTLLVVTGDGRHAAQAHSVPASAKRKEIAIPDGPDDGQIIAIAYRRTDDKKRFSVATIALG